ncbi:hypothetical protein [Salinibacter altiplanensis]|nr:hypothetical protein [Salinibacter altiplanensis]
MFCVTTNTGSYSIDDTIFDHFQDPFGYTGPKWIRDRENYKNSKWAFSS